MRILVLCVFLTLSACGGTARAMRATLATAAQGVVVADELVADRYEAASHTNLEVADTLEEYRSLMAPFDRAEAALRAAREALLSAERMVDDLAEGAEQGGGYALACSVAALGELVETLTRIGAEVPSGIRTALEVLSPIVKEACRVER